jgi:OFA family oxalate/formate antiporter-like MFS transporter
LLVGIFVPIVGLNGACMQNIVPYAANHGLTPQTGARLLSLLSLMHVLAVLGLGLVSDRFGNRVPFIGLAAVMVAGAALLAAGSDLSVIVAGCVLIGLGGGVFTPLASAIAIEFGAEGVGRAFGLCMFFIPLTSLAPFALAKTQEVSGSYAPAFVGAGIILAISGVLGLLLRERRGAATASIAAQAAASANTI